MLERKVEGNAKRGRPRTEFLNDIKGRRPYYLIRPLVGERKPLEDDMLPTNLRVEEKKKGRLFMRDLIMCKLFVPVSYELVDRKITMIVN